MIQTNDRHLGVMMSEASSQEIAAARMVTRTMPKVPRRWLVVSGASVGAATGGTIFGDAAGTGGGGAGRIAGLSRSPALWAEGARGGRGDGRGAVRDAASFAADGGG